MEPGLCGYGGVPPGSAIPTLGRARKVSPITAREPGGCPESVSGHPATAKGTAEGSGHKYMVQVLHTLHCGDGEAPR